MCEQLRKYIYDERKIDISAAARELDVEKETLRTWVRGLAIPRPPHMTKVCEWSKDFVQPQHFYTPQPGRCNGPLAGEAREAAA